MSATTPVLLVALDLQFLPLAQSRVVKCIENARRLYNIAREPILYFKLSGGINKIAKKCGVHEVKSRRLRGVGIAIYLWNLFQQGPAYLIPVRTFTSHIFPTPFPIGNESNPSASCPVGILSAEDSSLSPCSFARCNKQMKQKLVLISSILSRGYDF
jgi:hypothetical protein